MTSTKLTQFSLQINTQIIQTIRVQHQLQIGFEFKVLEKEHFVNSPFLIRNSLFVIYTQYVETHKKLRRNTKSRIKHIKYSLI